MKGDYMGLIEFINEHIYTTKKECDLICSNYYRYYRTFALSDVVDFHEGDISWIIPKEGENGPALAFNIQLKQETAEKEIQKLIEGIRDKKVPSLWFVTPDTKPNNIISLLEQSGFENLSSASDDPEPGMLLNKDDFRPYHMADDGITCRKVQSREEFCTWIDIVNIALHGWEMINAENYYTWLENGIYDFYLAEINGIPVSTAATIRSGNTASLEFVSTLKEYRRKRAGITVSSNAISELFANGVEDVTLSGSLEAVALYQKLGFHSCFENILLKYILFK